MPQGIPQDFPTWCLKPRHHFLLFTGQLSYGTKSCLAPKCQSSTASDCSIYTCSPFQIYIYNVSRAWDCIVGYYNVQGCQREVIKKEELQEGKTSEILSEMISSDLDESRESIFWCKKHGFPQFGKRSSSLNVTKKRLFTITDSTCLALWELQCQSGSGYMTVVR